MLSQLSLTAIVQDAIAAGTGYATNAITNGGSITIGADGYASGHGAQQTARAAVGGAICQGANAADGGLASNTISNDGRGRHRHHRICDRDLPAGDADANAYITERLVQHAEAFGGGNAVNALANDGTLNIDAHAVAAGHRRWRQCIRP